MKQVVPGVRTYSRLATVLTLCLAGSVGMAQEYTGWMDNPPAPNMPYQAARFWHGYRIYYQYPYLSSYGPRYDPYWSYTTSRFPYLYQGDGSYYGLGYSGYAGDGWYGSYYYW